MEIYNFNEFVNEGLFFKKLDFNVLEKKLENCYECLDNFEIRPSLLNFEWFIISFKRIKAYINNRAHLINNTNINELYDFIGKLKYFTDKYSDFKEKYKFSTTKGEYSSPQERYEQLLDKFQDSIKDIVLIKRKMDRISGENKQIVAKRKVSKNIIDRILDKVSKLGYDKLTKEEKEILKRESENDLNDEK